MDRLISTQHNNCYSSFQNLVDSLQHPPRDFGDQLPPVLYEVQEQLVRYRAWAGNVGATHSGSRWRISLDYRLREAPFYKEQASRSVLGAHVSGFFLRLTTIIRY